MLKITCMRYLFILSLLITITTQSFSQQKGKGQDRITYFDNNPRMQNMPNSGVSNVNEVTAYRYSKKSLMVQPAVLTNNLQADPFSDLESCRIQGASGSDDGRFTPFKGIVIGYNYVCITKGAWQWESGRLKYFFNSRLTGSIKAKIKYFKFDNVELNLNFKL